MEVTDVNGLSARLRQAANRQLCSERGVQMTEVDQLRDDGAVFVWYECKQGQWLQKASVFYFNKV